MKKPTVLLAAGFVFFATLLSIGCRQISSNEEVLGAVLNLSGDNALWGQNARKSIDMLTDEINKNGGINGKHLRIIYEDSRGDPMTAISGFRKLVDINRVPAVLGDMLSSTTLAMAPLANETKTVLIGISCSSPAVTTAGPYVYRVWPSDLYEGHAFADWAYNTGIRSVSIAFINNDYGNGLKSAFASRFRQLGGRVVLEEGYSQITAEVRDLAAKLVQTPADAIYIVGYYEDTALVVKELRQIGYKGKLLGTSSSIQQKLIEIAGTAANGFTAALVNDFDLQNLTATQKEFLKNYRARYGEDPDWAATHAGDALEVAVACIRKGATDGPEIKACIDHQKTFDGIDKSVTFDENGDVVNKPISIKIVRNSTFVNLGK